MKNLKIAFFSILLVALSFTSCTNNETLVEEQNIDESTSITTSLSQLRTQFNSQGDVIPTENPTGNIVFDFCFDFVYPLNLSYNNGTTVTVNNLDELIDITLSSTEELYISGIEFPFDVEVYDEDQDAIVVATINNEEEFVALLETCDFGDEFDCECTEEYNPVCVEVTAPDGETFLMTYPNACYAECDGFTEADFADNCEEDYNCPGGTDCFTFNFPLTIVTDNGDTITVNSQEELDTALYDAYYFDFVYSFDVTLEDGTVLTIGNEEAFIELLETCFGAVNNCIECVDEEYDPVCIEVETASGTEIITFPNACFAECEGFTADDFIECEDNNQSYCSEEEINTYLQSCVWLGYTSLYENVAPEFFQFNADGSLATVNVETNETVVIGTWSTSSEPSTGQLYMSFTSETEPYTQFAALDWTVVQCDESAIVLQSNNEILVFELNCE